MKERFHRRIPEDLSRVEIREQWQITFWTLELHTTQDRLTQAVRQSGHQVENVRAWLEKNPAPRRPLN